MFQKAALAALAIPLFCLQQDPSASAGARGGLDSVEPAVRLRAFQAIKSAGGPAIARVIQQYETAPPVARELMARLLREAGTPAEVGAAEVFIYDPNPLVRAEIAQFFGRPDFAYAAVEARCANLLRLACDGEFNVRDAALRALQRLAHRSAVDGLLELIQSGDAQQRSGALRALGLTSESAPALLSLQKWAGSAGASELPLWLLTLGITGDPAVVPVLLKYAGDTRAGSAAADAFDLLVQRLQFKRRDAEFINALDAWAPLDPVGTAWRRTKFELLVRFDLQAARAAALRLDATAVAAPKDQREWRAIAHAIVAICSMAQHDHVDAAKFLQIARDLADGKRRDSPDGDEGEGLLILSARMRVLSAFLAILHPTEGGPSPGMLLQEAYALFRERVFSGIVRSSAWPAMRKNPDERDRMIFLVMQQKPIGFSAGWNFDAALESEFGLMSVLASVFPRHGRGSDGLKAGIELLDILSDINPREFVTKRHAEDWMNAPDPFLQINLGRIPSFPVSPVFVSLTIPVSSLTRDLGQIARSILGDMDAANALLEPVVERAAAGTQRLDLEIFVEASLEQAGVAMDQQKPDVAENIINRVFAKLDPVKSTNEQLFDEESVRQGGGVSAEARTLQAKLWLDLERRLRARALISKAVNENVVRGRPEIAAKLAKEGVALDPTEFNKVVLACYLAREGNVTEAREALRESTEAPGTFYNLACTHALLGESERAVYYLQKDFEDHADQGGLERQRAWARKDPDLKSLREDSRFMALVAPEGATSKPARERGR